MKNLYFVLISLILLSCKTQENKIYSVNDICNCFEKSAETNLDTKLNSCLTDFNKNLTIENAIEKNTDLENFTKNELSKLIGELIEECPTYQKEFGKILENKFLYNNIANIKDKDSIEMLVLRNIETAKNIGKLSEIAIKENDFIKSLELINKSIKLNPKSEYPYRIRAFLYKRNGELKKAIEDIKTINKIDTISDSKKFNELVVKSLTKDLENRNK
ncbi:tetratricopeptide repeat protein [Flavobacterium sp. SM2513]|uniref:tetratricopeptide repeat protein n=1 Tax=Flavobacterium sp. SM2513 TaxID=3424766 RepID=UPI003D7FE240